MNYLVVPDNLKPKELLVYAWLYSNANHTTAEFKGLLKNEVYASSRLISLDTEMSQQHASRTLTLLEDSGYITCLFKSKKPNQRSKYFLDFNLNYKAGDVSVNVSEQVSVNESVDVSVQSVDLTESEAEFRSVDVSVNESVDVSVNESSSLNSHLMSLNNQKDSMAELVRIVYKHHLTLKGLPQAQKLTEARKSTIGARIKDYGYDEVLKTLEVANSSKFLNESKKTNWYNFDWIYNPNNFIKIIEGNYSKEYEQQHKQNKLNGAYSEPEKEWGF